jgi:hypothetical protein
MAAGRGNSCGKRVFHPAPEDHRSRELLSGYGAAGPLLPVPASIFDGVPGGLVWYWVPGADFMLSASGLVAPLLPSVVLPLVPGAVSAPVEAGGVAASLASPAAEAI